MKSKKNTLSLIHHKAIRTRHVFIENDQVFLKRTLADTQMNSSENEEWFPINFQWTPILKLHQNMLLISAGTTLD